MGGDLALMGEAEARARASMIGLGPGRAPARMGVVLRLTGAPDAPLWWASRSSNLRPRSAIAPCSGQYLISWGRNTIPSATSARQSSYYGGAWRQADWGKSGTPSTDMRSRSRVWLTWPLTALGAFAEGRRHGEEALRLATRESRGNAPIQAHPARPPVPRPRGPGRRPGCWSRAWPVSRLRQPGPGAIDLGGPGLTPLCYRGVSQRGARYWKRRSAKALPHGRAGR